MYYDTDNKDKKLKAAITVILILHVTTKIGSIWIQKKTWSEIKWIQNQWFNKEGMGSGFGLSGFEWECHETHNNAAEVR